MKKKHELIRLLLYAPFDNLFSLIEKFDIGKLTPALMHVFADNNMHTHYLVILNEAIYQIIRAYDDFNPDEGIYNNYIEEIKEDMPNKMMSTLCLVSIVAILTRQENLSFAMSSFCSQLRSYCMEDQLFCKCIEQIEEEVKDEAKLCVDFSPIPTKPGLLITDDKRNSWYYVTRGYQMDAIVTILDRYKEPLDRRTVMLMIHSSFKKDSEMVHDMDLTGSGFVTMNNPTAWIDIVNKTLKIDNLYRTANEAFFVSLQKCINIDAFENIDKVFKEPWWKRLYNYFFNIQAVISLDGLGGPELSIKSVTPPEVFSLRQRLYNVSAKSDMFAQENEQLKQEIARLKRDIPEQIKQAEKQREKTLLEKAINMDRIVNAALADHNVVFVDNVQTLLYKLTGRVISDEKDQAIEKLQHWANLLRSAHASINIDTINQYGGIIAENINNEIETERDKL